MSLGELSEQDRRQRVLTVLAAARRLTDPRDPIGERARLELPPATGLSPAGVELGLAKHVETSVAPKDLDRLLARAGSAERVHVILSAQVFVGAVRAIAVAAAASSQVLVRSSRREPVMVPLLWQAANELGYGALFQLDDGGRPFEPGDDVHVYGRRETIEAVARASPPGVHVRGHGPGLGIAIVEPNLDPGLATRLSWDIVPFDQRGCLSPRVAFVNASEREARAFAAALAAELDQRETEIPRGILTDEERHELSLYAATVRSIGDYVAGRTFAVGLDKAPQALLLPPTGRHVHLVRIERHEDVARLLRPLVSLVTCVGVSGESPLSLAAPSLVPAGRVSVIGKMQSPLLDGPVDLRDMVSSRR